MLHNVCTDAPTPLSEQGLPGYPVRLEDIERQIRFETSGVERGVKRYRDSIRGAPLGDTPPGMMAARDMLKTLVPAIRAEQEACLEALAAANRGAPPVWTWLLPLLSAEKMAVIATRTVLVVAHPWKAVTPYRMVASVAIAIGTAVQTELEFEAWADDEKEAQKAAKEEDPDTDRVDLFKAITSRAKKVDARSFRRWRRKVASIRRLNWDRSMKIHLGTKLISLLVKHGGGWFEVTTVRRMGKTEQRLHISEHAREAIEDVNARMEINRPLLMPMVVPPKPWRRL